MKKCKYCGKEVSVYKYFCDIDCELKYTDKINESNTQNSRGE